MAKRYRHSWDEAPQTGDEGSREAYLEALSAELIRRFRLRRRAGQAQVVDAELWVDPAGMG